MPRIPLVTEASMTADQRRVYDAMMTVRAARRRWVRSPRPCIARTSPRHGPISASCSASTRASRRGCASSSSCSPAASWDCQFEWFSHEAEARKAGLSEQTIETLRHGGSAFAQQDEQAIHDYTIELLRHRRASDATYQRILTAYGTPGIVELTALIGYYAMVALTLNAHEIGVPDGATPPLPPLPREVESSQSRT